jgi:hypothetical protein
MYAWRGIKQNTRAMELQILESIFRDVRELDREYIAEFHGWTHEQRNAWSATFFNTVEYLCFMVNQRITRDKALRSFFFADAIPAWRKMFAEHVTLGFINDEPSNFPEFKQAWKLIPPQKRKPQPTQLDLAENSASETQSMIASHPSHARRLTVPNLARLCRMPRSPVSA